MLLSHLALHARTGNTVVTNKCYWSIKIDTTFNNIFKVALSTWWTTSTRCNQREWYSVSIWAPLVWNWFTDHLQCIVVEFPPFSHLLKPKFRVFFYMTMETLCMPPAHASQWWRRHWEYIWWSSNSILSRAQLSFITHLLYHLITKTYFTRKMYIWIYIYIHVIGTT